MGVTTEQYAMIEQDKPLRKQISLALSGSVSAYTEIKSEDDLRSALVYAAKNNLNIRILGEGTNTLIKAHTEALVLKDCRNNIAFRKNADGILVSAQAGVEWHDLVLACLVGKGYGLENLALIPGSVGAAPVQNIGAYGVEIADFVYEVHTIDLRRSSSEKDIVRRIFTREECDFSYRDSFFKQHAHTFLIEKVELLLNEEFLPKLNYSGLTHLTNECSLSAARLVDEVINLRRTKLPDYRQLPNAGSFFKNPVVDAAHASKLKQTFANLPVFELSSSLSKLSAAWMLDHLGYRGKAINGFQFYNQHALVLTHPPQGLCVRPQANDLSLQSTETDADRLASLIDQVSQHVWTVFGVQLEVEPQWL